MNIIFHLELALVLALAPASEATTCCGQTPSLFPSAMNKGTWRMGCWLFSLRCCYLPNQPVRSLPGCAACSTNSSPRGQRGQHVLPS